MKRRALQHGSKHLLKFSLATHYIGEKIDLKKLQDGLKKYHYLNRDHPLVLELAKNEFVAVTKFGAISFWNVKESLIREFLQEIAPYAASSQERYHHTDTLIVFLGAPKERVTFEELYLTDRELTVDQIKIISYVSAQSVALDRYEEEIDKRLKDLGKVVENLKSGGKTSFTEKDLLRQVGNVLSVKQNTVSSLSLFDKPDETWERPELEQLYDRLRSEYELRDRFDVLNEKIDFLSENNTTLINFITSRKSNALEIIVIVLIVVEIIIFVLDIMKVK